MKQPPLVLFDIDGTLLTDDKHLLPSTSKAIQDLAETGTRVGIATGRSPYAIERLLPEWGLNQACSYIVAFNGAMVLDRKDGSVLKNHWLLPGQVQTILQDLEGWNINPGIFDGTCFHAGFDEHYAHEVAGRNRLDLSIDGLEAYKDREVSKILCMGDADVLDAYMESHPAGYDGYYLVRSTPLLMEFMAQGVGKATGIAMIAEKENLDLKNIVVFGDALNDLDMMEACSSVAMKNAHPNILALADDTTDKTNNADGVGDYIRTRFLRADKDTKNT